MLARYKQFGCQIEIVQIEHNHQEQRAHTCHQIVYDMESRPPPVCQRRQEEERPQSHVARTSQMFVDDKNLTHA